MSNGTPMCARCNTALIYRPDIDRREREKAAAPNMQVMVCPVCGEVYRVPRFRSRVARPRARLARSPSAGA